MSADTELSPRQPLRVLLLEDSRADAELVLWRLRREGYEPLWDRVETAKEFRDKLHPELHLILADYRLPHFDALGALKILEESGLDVPMIIVSGSMSEDAAVKCLENGASDYLIKDRPARLGGAVRQALEDRRLRAEKHAAKLALRHAYKELERQSRELRRLQRSTGDALAVLEEILAGAAVGIALVNSDGFFLQINPAMAAIDGHSVGEHLGHPVWELWPELWAQIEPLLPQILTDRDKFSNLPVSGPKTGVGEARPYFASFYPILNSSRKVSIGVNVISACAHGPLLEPIVPAMESVH